MNVVGIVTNSVSEVTAIQTDAESGGKCFCPGFAGAKIGSQMPASRAKSTFSTS